MLCCAVPLCGVLCCSVLCCAVPCRAVPCRFALCCAALCCAALPCAVLRCLALCCAALCCAVSRPYWTTSSGEAGSQLLHTSTCKPQFCKLDSVPQQSKFAKLCSNVPLAITSSAQLPFQEDPAVPASHTVAELYCITPCPTLPLPAPPPTPPPHTRHPPPTQVLLLQVAIFSGPGEGKPAVPTSLEAAQFHCIHLLRVMVKLLPSWLPEPLFKVLQERWHSSQRIMR